MLLKYFAFVTEYVLRVSKIFNVYIGRKTISFNLSLGYYFFDGTIFPLRKDAGAVSVEKRTCLVSVGSLPNFYYSKIK